MFAPRLASAMEQLLTPRGSWYTQMAVRTPHPARARLRAAVGAPRPKQNEDYHLDGQGQRFPDCFSLLVCIALSDQRAPDCGNFTVYPGSHLDERLRSYPSMSKQDQPDLGPGVQQLLAPGDAVLAHVLLAHRGGPNLAEVDRDCIFFRIQAEQVDYEAPDRTARIFRNRFCEFDRLSASECKTTDKPE